MTELTPQQALRQVARELPSTLTLPDDFPRRKGCKGVIQECPEPACLCAYLDALFPEIHGAPQ